MAQLRTGSTSQVWTIGCTRSWEIRRGWRQPVLFLSSARCNLLNHTCSNASTELCSMDYLCTVGTARPSIGAGSPTTKSHAGDTAPCRGKVVQTLPGYSSNVLEQTSAVAFPGSTSSTPTDSAGGASPGGPAS